MPQKTLVFLYNYILIPEANKTIRTDIHRNELLVVPGQNNTYRVKLHLLPFGSKTLKLH